MRSPEGGSARPALREIAEQVERTLDQVESLLGAERLEEATRVLERNEGRLLALSGPIPARAAGPGAPARREPGVATRDQAPYPSTGTGERLRLAGLLRRTGELLSRCEAARAQTAGELRRVREAGRFGAGAAAWSWLDRRA